MLFGGEDIRATNHPKVLRAVGNVPDAGMAGRVDALIRRAVTDETEEGELRDVLRAIVPGFAREDARTDPHLAPSHEAATSAAIEPPRPSISR